VNSGTFWNDAAIVSTKALGQINVSSNVSTAGNNLVIEGTYGSYATSGLGNRSINFSVAGNNTLDFEATQSFDPGTTGSLNFAAVSSGASNNIGAGQVLTLTNVSPWNINTPTLSFG